MDANTILQVAAQAHVLKLRTEAWQKQSSQDPFAVYDALTPKEPTWAWLVAKRLLAALIHILTARQSAPVPSNFAPRPSMREIAQ